MIYLQFWSKLRESNNLLGMQPTKTSNDDPWILDQRFEPSIHYISGGLIAVSYRRGSIENDARPCERLRTSFE